MPALPLLATNLLSRFRGPTDFGIGTGGHFPFAPARCPCTIFAPIADRGARAPEGRTPGLPASQAGRATHGPAWRHSARSPPGRSVAPPGARLRECAGHPERASASPCRAAGRRAPADARGQGGHRRSIPPPACGKPRRCRPAPPHGRERAGHKGGPPIAASRPVAAFRASASTPWRANCMIAARFPSCETPFPKDPRMTLRIPARKFRP